MRINGVNSDYKFSQSSGGIIEVKPQPDKLYMKLFICPDGQKNSLESESGTCSGISETCPGAGKKQHAMICLSQDDGITLQTDNKNQVHIDQSGTIEIKASETTYLKLGKVIEMSVENVDGSVTALSTDGKSITINSKGNKIEMMDGNITLTPAPGGAVAIMGNLTVNGTINGKTF